MRLLFLFLFPLSVFSQTNTDGYCHFAVSSVSSGATEDLTGYSIPLYKHKTVREVYARLSVMHGNFSMTLPTCRLIRLKEHAASYSASDRQIMVEEKAYDVCVSLGADSLAALALLISHELMHFYEKHAFNVSEQQKREQEKMADLKGGILAQRAGFQVADVQARLLDGIYNAYRLPSVMTGYPTREERIRQAGEVKTQIERLWYRFKLANYMAVTGKYDNAIAYYHSIEDTFPSREILQNLSTVYAIRALELREKVISETQIMFPFELDPESRLSKGDKALEDSMTINNIEMLNNLNQALDFAVQAIRLDENYVPARVNRACALMLLERYEEARKAILETGVLLSEDDDAAKALLALLRGNLLYLEKRDDYVKRSAREWTKARDWGNRLAGINLQLANGSWQPGPAQMTGQKEQMPGLNLTAYLEDLHTYDYATPLIRNGKFIAVGSGAQKHYTGAHTKNLNASVVLIDYVDIDNKSVWQYTLPGNRGQTLKGISIGSTEKMVRDQYGPPSSTVETPLGRYLHYRKSSLVFLIENGVVGEWVVYRVKGRLNSY